MEVLIKNTQSTGKCWKPDAGYLQVLISVHLGHVEVPFQLPQILYPLSAHTGTRLQSSIPVAIQTHMLSAHTQAQDCSHPFQWPFKHTCSLHTHRHKTAVIHSSGHSNTHALCTHTGTRQQSSIPVAIQTHMLSAHTQAQDSSHPFHSHSSTSAFCTHRHKTAVIYCNSHSDTHILCTHRHKTAVIYSNVHSDTHALCTHKHLLSA